MDLTLKLICLLLSINAAWIATTNGQLLSKDMDLFDIKLNMTNNNLREIIEHFKTVDPVGLPGAPIPDPMPTPDIRISKTVNLHLQKSNVFGLSKFKIELLKCNLNSLEVQILLVYRKLEMLGQYSATAWPARRSKGGYNATILDVTLGGTAAMDTSRNGHLEVVYVDLDMFFKDIKLFFENPIFELKLVQGMVNSIGGFIFDQMKPLFLRDLNTRIKDEMNKNMNILKKTFPNSITPLDLAIAEGRKYVREEGFDPYALTDYEYNTGLMTVYVRDIRLLGLASFFRLGNMTVTIKNNTLIITSHVSTQKIEGKCNWEVSLAQMTSTFGSTDFTIDYIQVETKLNQSLNLRNKPALEDMNIYLGNLQLRSDGLGTLDYALELLVNVFPNLLRYHIVEGLEGVLKRRIQTVLKGLDVEALVEKQISQFDSIIVQDKILEFDDYTDSIKDPDDLTNLYDTIGS